jgi:two-component system CheB/CheR fusion protein
MGDGRPETSYHPIDQFFRALAADQKEHAICIVLSGSGNDGALGLKAIKAAGGMAMVQDSASAQYTGMPDSAAATGLADYVLPPGQMPAALIEYCRGPYLKLARRAELVAIPDDAIQAILVRLRARTGHDFTCYKRSTMSRRIERRMNVHRIDEPKEYLRYLRENPREVDVLLQDLLIIVTSFFRDREAFESLADKGIPGLLAQREGDQTLRVWVPGCATGEEAYSVAILLYEQIRKADRLHQMQIFATDLDEQAIEVARSGLYSEGIAADVSPERLSQYFSREDGSYRINKNIRDMIVFAVQNVVSDPPFTRLDMIVCRNLLIYLDAAAQRRVLQVFHYALRPGGLLFLGASETPGVSANLFDTVDGKNKILRRKEVPAQVHPALAAPATPRAPGRGAPGGRPRSAAGPVPVA